MRPYFKIGNDRFFLVPATIGRLTRGVNTGLKKICLLQIIFPNPSKSRSIFWKFLEYISIQWLCLMFNSFLNLKKFLVKSNKFAINSLNFSKKYAKFYINTLNAYAHCLWTMSGNTVCENWCLWTLHLLYVNAKKIAKFVRISNKFDEFILKFYGHIWYIE
jgi:hypothetical protein